MPTTKDFKGPKKVKAAAKNVDIDDAMDTEIDAAATRSKRRPGREMDEDVEATAGASTSEDSQQKFDLEKDGARDVTDTEEEAAGMSTGRKARRGSDEDLADLEREAQEPSDAPKIEISFKGSELIRSRIPTAFALVEAVATDWVYGGEFDKLPINQPLAKFAAQQGLLKAKEVEKKVMESPQVEKAAMQVLMAGMKAQTLVTQLREKLRR